MDDLAQANLLDHYRHPRNQGVIEHPTVSREEHNPLCGDRVRMDLVIEDDVITDLRFSGRGCTISQASASMLTEELKGRPVEEAKAFGKEQLLELIGIPIGYTRMKCALLSLKALKVGIYTAHGESWDPDDIEGQSRG
jgi:nitrogen fixation NifU-like protein